MNRVVRVNATDGRIAYAGPWTTKRIGTSSTGDTYVMSVLDVHSSFFIMFRGTRITMYGWSPFVTVSITFTLENNTTIVRNGTGPGSGISPICQVDNIGDGDHQLRGDIATTEGDFEIFYFEIEVSSGDPLDLLSAGPAARNVPALAVTVDSSDPGIKYDTPEWTSEAGGINYYQRSRHSTLDRGSSLSYAFDGVAIWYYSQIGPHFGFFNVSIDGSTPQRLTAKSNLSLSQQLIWSNTSLCPGRHNITLTHDDTSGSELGLDFFRTLPEGSTSMLLSSFPTTSSRPVGSTNLNQTNSVTFAVGLTLGLLALVVSAIGSVCYLYRRRGRMRVDLDGHPVSPYTAPPMRRAGPALPQSGKRPLQPPQPSGPLMPLITTELGPPPSYESPRDDWRVGATQ